MFSDSKNNLVAPSVPDLKRDRSSWPPRGPSIGRAQDPLAIIGVPVVVPVTGISGML